MEQVACAPRVARERAGALRNGGGAEWQRASVASECPEGHRKGIGGNREPPSERSERGNRLPEWVCCFLVEGHRRKSGDRERAERARVCLPAHAYACACSAHMRTVESFIYRNFRWFLGVFLFVIAYRIY